MKSIAEIKAIKEKMQSRIIIRENSDENEIKLKIKESTIWCFLFNDYSLV